MFIRPFEECRCFLLFRFVESLSLEHLDHCLTGERSLPSMLGGGDLDGQVVF
jgi:hypothetical protein